jgi:site-specific DNA-methyltransferase (adenine-specific)
MIIEGYTDKHSYVDKFGIPSTVYLMDCMVGMKQIPEKAIDLAIPDIPYGIGVAKMAFTREVKTTVRQKNGTKSNPNKNKKVHAPKDWDDKCPEQEYFNLLQLISKHQIIFGADYAKWDGLGKGRIKWDKGVAEGVSFSKYECAYQSFTENEIEVPMLWAGMCQAKSLSEPMVQQGNKALNEKRIHPCHKPILLYLRLLLDFAPKNGLILDTHVGSQSSRIAAERLSLPYIAFETDKGHFYDGCERFDSHIRVRESEIQFPMY